MQIERINSGVFLDIIIYHETKLIELDYFRSCKVHEVLSAVAYLQSRNDWNKISQYRFKAEY